MRIHHLRNATFVIETGTHHLLIDPMLSKAGALPPFAWLKHSPRRNPLVSLPDTAPSILERVTHCLLTHCQKLGIEALTHTDHLDPAGLAFVQEKAIPVICLRRDAPYLIKKEIEVPLCLTYWQAEPFSGGQIMAIPARHGHGWIHYGMANGAGFFITLPDEPSLYISGDTVYTPDVEHALTELKPDIAVVAAGGASLDVGGPILMPLEEVLHFIKKAPGKAIANHMEALNHCPTTRPILKAALAKNDLLAKTYIPKDGESFEVSIDLA